MAVCGIWKIKTRLDNVINYTTNKEKTINDDLYKDLHQVIDYTSKDNKTEKKYYVTGINCNPDSAYEEMINTKKHFYKTDGILGFHAFQSFKKDEVTPELAHNIGIKLATEMWGDRFEVVVSTHLDTGIYHNHFVINSVSFRDGKKYYDNHETYAEMRHLSDSICNEFGLSVIKEHKTKKGIDYTKFYKQGIVKSNYHTLTKEDIDSAIKQAYSYNDFERILSAMGYDLIYRNNKLSVRHNPYKKNIRLVRSYGDEYSKDNIIKRINREIGNREAIPISRHTYNKRYYYNANKHSFYKIFTHYLWLLKIVPKKYPKVYVSPLIRADVKKMDMISEETKLLVSNKINTYEEFFLYRNNIDNKYSELKDKRDKLWKNLRKVDSDVEKNKIMGEIDRINIELEPLRKKVELCKDIEFRSKDIEEKLNIQEKEKEREKNNESR